MNIAVGSIWKYKDHWSTSRYEVLEVQDDGVIMRLTHRGGNTFCGFAFIQNNLMQVNN